MQVKDITGQVMPRAAHAAATQALRSLGFVAWNGDDRGAPLHWQTTAFELTTDAMHHEENFSYQVFFESPSNYENLAHRVEQQRDVHCMLASVQCSVRPLFDLLDTTSHFANGHTKLHAALQQSVARLQASPFCHDAALEQTCDGLMVVVRQPVELHYSSNAVVQALEYCADMLAGMMAHWHACIVWNKAGTSNDGAGGNTLNALTGAPLCTEVSTFSASFTPLSPRTVSPEEK